MSDFEVVQYLLSAAENNYIEKLNFSHIEKLNISIDVIVADQYRIKPVLWMIEANAYTNKALRVKSVECEGNILKIQCFDDKTYDIKVKAIKKNKRKRRR